MIAVEVVDAGVARAFGALRRGLVAAQRAAWATVGAEALEDTIPLVPVESARLAGSLVSAPGATGVEISSDVVYAGVQNFGWPARNIAGHHFMDRAEGVIEDQAPVELENELQSLIRRVGLN